MACISAKLRLLVLGWYILSSDFHNAKPFLDAAILGSRACCFVVPVNHELNKEYNFIDIAWCSSFAKRSGRLSSSPSLSRFLKASVYLGSAYASILYNCSLKSIKSYTSVFPPPKIGGRPSIFTAPSRALDNVPSYDPGKLDDADADASWCTSAN